jgi:hypothetical protein
MLFVFDEPSFLFKASGVPTECIVMSNHTVARDAYGKLILAISIGNGANGARFMKHLGLF